MGNRGWITINLRKTLLNKIKAIINDDTYGKEYKNATHFVDTAVQEKLDQMDQKRCHTLTNENVLVVMDHKVEKLPSRADMRAPPPVTRLYQETTFFPFYSHLYGVLPSCLHRKTCLVCDVPQNSAKGDVE